MPDKPKGADTGRMTLGGKDYLTYPNGLAHEFKLAPRTIRRWRASGIKPPLISIGGYDLVDPDDLPGWLETFRRRAGAA